MYVYANHLTFENGSDQAYGNILDVIANWLSYKVKQSLSGSSLEHGFEVRGNGHQIRANAAENEPDLYPWMTSVELTHGDSEVSGRRWSTQIGIKQQSPNSKIELSILLQTSEISSEVGVQPVVTTRPGVVAKLHDSSGCQLAETNVGQVPIPIEIGEVDTLERLINDERNWGIVLVSPDPHTGEPLVDVSYLQRQVIGLAQVIHIQTNTDAFNIYKRLGSVRSAHSGAINVLHPRVRIESGFIPHDLLFKDELLELKEKDDNSVERTILQKVVHRQNLRLSWQHLSPQDVQRHRLHQRLHRLQQDVQSGDESGQVQELLSLYKEVNTELRGQVDDLEQKVEALKTKKQAVEEELEEKKNKVSGLQYQLGRKQEKEEDEVSEEPPLRQFRDVEEVAEAVGQEMGQSIYLRNRAHRSMRKSPYDSPADVYRAFWLLQNHFYPAFSSSDHSLDDAVDKANQMYIEYGGHMSNSTMGQFDDYTSKYKGRDADMNKHLKLGSSSHDPQYHFRIHFEWDEEDEMIVIHHAGKHLLTTKS